MIEVFNKKKRNIGHTQVSSSFELGCTLHHGGRIARVHCTDEDIDKLIHINLSMDEDQQSEVHVTDCTRKFHALLNLVALC